MNKSKSNRSNCAIVFSFDLLQKFESILSIIEASTSISSIGGQVRIVRIKNWGPLDIAIKFFELTLWPRFLRISYLNKIATYTLQDYVLIPWDVLTYSWHKRNYILVGYIHSFRFRSFLCISKNSRSATKITQGPFWGKIMYVLESISYFDLKSHIVLHRS